MLTFEQIHELRRFARYWDLIGNSGNFVNTLQILIGEQASPFDRLMQFSKWLYTQEQRRHGIALIRLFERIFEYLTTELRLPEQKVAEVLWQDYSRGRRDRPHFLRRFELPAAVSQTSALLPGEAQLPSRQAKHTQ